MTPSGLRGPPTPDVAPAYQFRAEEMARRRRAFLFGEARGQIGTAMQIFSRYRLGGANAGAMMSLYRDQANIFGTEASQVSAPDMMYRVREDAAIKAARAQERASRMQLAGGIIQAAATVAGGFAGAGGIGAAAITGGSNVASSLIAANARGGGPGAMDPYAAPGMEGGQPSTAGQPAMQQPWSPEQVQQFNQGMQGGMSGSPGWTPGGPPASGGGPEMGGGGFPGGGGGAAPMRMGGPAGGSGGGGPGAAPGKGGGAGAPAGAGAPGGGEQGGAMGMQGPPNGGYGQQGDFTPKALATAAAITDPDVEEIVTLAYANWLQQDRSTEHWENVIADRLMRWTGEYAA